MANAGSVCLSVRHARGPRLTVQDVKTYFAPHDTAMFLVS